MAPLSLALAIALLATAFPLHAAAGRRGFSIELIHRDSPRSPLYDPSATPFDRATAASHRSAARARRFSASIAATGDETVVSKLFSADGEYVMELKLGTPPTTVVAIADTGSDLIWTNCRPCDQCFSQVPPLFDPKKSSTYGTLSCDADACNALPQQTCGRDSTCEYQYRYGDQSNVDGVLSTETATFTSSSGNKVTVKNVEFGCNFQSSGTFSNKTSGLVGLGAGPLSLVSQLSSSFKSKFSYCLVPSSSSSSSKISFGDDAVVSGKNVVSTPLHVAMGTFYALNLEKISVGGQSVDVTRVTPLETGGGNIVIDSGTTLTLLDGSIVDDLVKALEGEISFPAVSDPTGVGFPACYDISGSSEGSVEFPDITFEFEGATVVLKPLNWFIQVSDTTVCMAVSAVPQGGGIPQIFGNIAQQNFKVEYDMVANEVSFAPADCTDV